MGATVIGAAAGGYCADGQLAGRRPLFDFGDERRRGQILDSRHPIHGIAIHAHLIPVVDIGIVVRKTRNGNLRIADWRTSIATASRACLACAGQYDPAHVTLERDGSLDDPRYIEQLPQDSPLRASENVFGFSLGAASLATSQFLSLVVAPGGISNHGAQRYRFKTGDLEQAWPYLPPELPLRHHARGRRLCPRPLPTHRALHPAAQAARHRRQQAARRPAMRLARTLDDLTWRLR